MILLLRPIQLGGVELHRFRGRLSAEEVRTALSSNSIGYLIPCHRVLRSTGALSGYRWGSGRKLALLAWESASSREARSITASA